MNKFITSSIVLALLAGCYSEESKHEAAVRDFTESTVRPMLRDPDSAVFSDLRAFPASDNGGLRVCGMVNSRNGFGGMTGPQRFIVGQSIKLFDEDEDPQIMDTAWIAFCPPSAARSDG